MRSIASKKQGRIPGIFKSKGAIWGDFRADSMPPIAQDSEPKSLHNQYLYT